MRRFLAIFLGLFLTALASPSVSAGGPTAYVVAIRPLGPDQVRIIVEIIGDVKPGAVRVYRNVPGEFLPCVPLKGRSVRYAMPFLPDKLYMQDHGFIELLSNCDEQKVLSVNLFNIAWVVDDDTDGPAKSDDEWRGVALRYQAGTFNKDGLIAITLTSLDCDRWAGSILGEPGLRMVKRATVRFYSAQEFPVGARIARVTRTGPVALKTAEVDRYTLDARSGYFGLFAVVNPPSVCSN